MCGNTADMMMFSKVWHLISTTVWHLGFRDLLCSVKTSEIKCTQDRFAALPYPISVAFKELNSVCLSFLRGRYLKFNSVACSGKTWSTLNRKTYLCWPTGYNHRQVFLKLHPLYTRTIWEKWVVVVPAKRVGQQRITLDLDCNDWMENKCFCQLANGIG